MIIEDGNITTNLMTKEGYKKSVLLLIKLREEGHAT